MKTIGIEYLDKHGKVISRYDTGDPLDESVEWGEWMTDPATEHPGEPSDWDQYQLVQLVDGQPTRPKVIL